MDRYNHEPAWHKSGCRSGRWQSGDISTGCMANETKPQLFIMDEWLGDPIPLAEIKEISEPTLDEEYDMPDIVHLKEGFEVPFEVKMKKSAINKLFQPCFGREPYRNLEKCAKCILKNDCVVAKIENNFNMRLRAYHP